jgi:hypothetical protein
MHMAVDGMPSCCAASVSRQQPLGQHNFARGTRAVHYSEANEAQLHPAGSFALAADIAMQINQRFALMQSPMLSNLRSLCLLRPVAAAVKQQQQPHTPLIE